MIALVLAIYSYPALRTSAETRSRVLPPVYAPDISLYLNISSVKPAGSGAVDPYYGAMVTSARMGYLKFRIAFVLFKYLTAVIPNLFWSVFVWNLFWWGLLCALALWLFSTCLPESSPGTVLTCLAILMFFNFGILEPQISAWIHISSLQRFQTLELPYIRPFFPQVPIPLLILYLTLQIKALQRGGWMLWTCMAITQFIAFGTFPYAMLMMAGLTFVAVIAMIPARSAIRWTTVLPYALACAISDLLFFLHGSNALRSGAPGDYALIHLQLSILRHRIGGMWLILAVLTILVIFLQDLSPQVKWPLVGMGLTNLLLLLGDAFASETAVQLSHHAGYFVHTTTAVLFAFLLSAVFQRIRNRNPAWKLAPALIVAVLTVNGALIAEGTYRAFLATNNEQAELVRIFQSEPTTSSDLVIARSLSVDDDCSWVPLLSAAHPLYCRSAQVLLSPKQNQQIQRFHQALYLFFSGKDVQWVEQIIANPNATTELMRLMFLGQVTTDVADRAKGIAELRQDLIPFLGDAGTHDPGMRAFFSQYRRVIVIENLAHPYFVPSRLSAYLKIEKRQTVGDLIIQECSPLP